MSELAEANAVARVEGLTVRFNRHNGLLQMGLRLLTDQPPEALHGEMRALRPLSNARVEILPGAPGQLRVEGTAVLPPGMAPSELRLLLAAGKEPLLAVATGEVIEDRADLVSLEPTGDGAVAQAWSDPGIATQLWVDHRLEGMIKASPGLLRTRLPIRPNSIAVSADGRRGLPTNPLGGWLAAPEARDGRLDALRDRHAGATAWLIGNGPSVRPEDLDALRGQLCFGFNRLHLAYGGTSLRPRYTFSGDGQMIADFGEEIVAEAGGTVFLATESRPAIPGEWIWLRQLSIWPPLFSLDPGRVVGAGGSSLFAAMQVAWWMGVRRFVFYGIDFSFHGVEPGLDGLATAEGNHFIPGYRSGRPWIPPSWRDICSAFLLARRLAEAEGGWVRNATRGGQLEIFPRIRFEDALRLG
ncbi:hypothetical protein [Roseomonas elaeocarpi]|uniref:DUF115 domain-containing protein n=1 Tax=Roseomonas elaeocarpi TaxID=907779 RepID=A0ABV6JV58_9PROT